MTIDAELIHSLRVRPNDDEEEIMGKLRLYGRYRCQVLGDCPKEG